MDYSTCQPLRCLTEPIDSRESSLYHEAMGKLIAFALDTASRIIDKIPLEKMLVKSPDLSEDRKELLDILEQKPKQETPAKKPEEGRIEPRRAAWSRSRETGVSDAETVDYQNREIGKLLLRMERHYAQGLRINSKVCDCGAQKHLLDIEAMAEETISIADDPDVYERLIAWVHHVGPLSTVDAVASGQYDHLYPEFSQDARDFRKEIIGSLDPKALWPNSDASIRDLVRRAGDVRVVKVEKVPELPMPASAEVPPEETPVEQVETQEKTDQEE